MKNHFWITLLVLLAFAAGVYAQNRGYWTEPQMVSRVGRYCEVYRLWIMTDDKNRAGHWTAVVDCGSHGVSITRLD